MSLRVDVRAHGAYDGQEEGFILPVPEGATISRLLELVQGRVSSAGPVQQLRLDRGGVPGSLLCEGDKAADILRDGDILHAVAASKRPKQEAKLQSMKTEQREPLKRALPTEVMEIDDSEGEVVSSSAPINPDLGMSYEEPDGSAAMASSGQEPGTPRVNGSIAPEAGTVDAGNSEGEVVSSSAPINPDLGMSYEEPDGSAAMESSGQEPGEPCVNVSIAPEAGTVDTGNSEGEVVSSSAPINPDLGMSDKEPDGNAAMESSGQELEDLCVNGSIAPVAGTDAGKGADEKCITVTVSTLMANLEHFEVEVPAAAPLSVLREAVSAFIWATVPSATSSTVVAIFTDRHPLPFLSAEKEAGIAVLDVFPSTAKSIIYAHLIPKEVAREVGPEPGSSSAASDRDGHLAAFAHCSAWNPVGVRQSDAGMNCFLASLCVLGKNLTTNVSMQRRVLGHFRVLCRFPPAVAGLQAVLSGRLRQLSPQEKASLAHAIFNLLRRLAPPEVPDGNLFEHSRLAFSMLINRAQEADEANEIWRVMTVPAEGQDCIDDLCLEELERESVGGGEAFGRAWMARAGPWLRASRPNSREVSIWLGTTQALSLTRSCCFPWHVLCAECGRLEAKMLKLVSALTLPNATPFALTRGPDGQVAVFVGMPPCSVGEVLLFSPVKGDEINADPHKLAREVKQHCADADEQDVEGRHITEAVVVCFDTSHSMDGSTGFSDDAGSVEDDVEVPCNGWDEQVPADDSQEALTRALKQWQAHPNFHDFREALRRSKTHGAPRWEQEGKALMFLREVLKVEQLRSVEEGHGDADFPRIATRNRDQFVSTLMSGLEETSSGDSGLAADRPPEHFLCAITLDLMREPVVAMDGFTYERQAILDWLRLEPGRQPCSPMTGVTMLSADVRPNRNLQAQIREWRDRRTSASPAEEGSFNIFCRGPWPGTMTISVWPGATAADLRRQIAYREGGIPEELQVLRYQFRTLPERQDLVRSVGLTRDAVVNVQVDHNIFGRHSLSNMCSGCIAVKLQLGPSGKNINVVARRGDTVKTLLFRLWTHDLSTQPSKVTLWHGLKDVGDGCRAGIPLTYKTMLAQYEDASTQTAGVVTRRVNLELLNYRYNHNQKKRPRAMTRLDCVKQLFETFVNRIKAYNFPSDVGLVLFNTQAALACKPSAYIEDFRDQVSHASSAGDTALFDAINLAADTLDTWSRKHGSDQQGVSETPLRRIFVLSDGEDTKSSVQPWYLAKRLQTSKITLDAVHVGDCDIDVNLHCLAKCTGGYVFRPSSIHNALRTHELEVVLHGPERPTPVKSLPVVRSETDLRRFSQKHYPIDRADDTAVPSRRQPPQLCRRAVTLESACGSLSGDPMTADGAIGSVAVAGDGGAGTNLGNANTQSKAGTEVGNMRDTGTDTIARQRRLLREMRAIMQAPHANFDVFPCENDMGFWRLVLSMDQGPDMYTPYAGGCWLLYILFPTEYPERPPEVRFVTQIRHCNVNAHGRICHSILDRNYTTDTSVSDILGSIYALVLTPDADDAVDTALAFQCHEDPDSYRQAISQHVQRHAVQRDRKGWQDHLENATEEPQPALDVSSLSPATSMTQLREFIANHSLPIITSGRGRTTRTVLNDIFRHVGSAAPSGNLTG